jgi:hypothetical protein
MLFPTYIHNRMAGGDYLLGNVGSHGLGADENVILFFEQTLRAPRDGGSSPDVTGRPVRLPRTSDPDGATRTWAAFHARLQPASLPALQAESPHMLAGRRFCRVATGSQPDE